LLVEMMGAGRIVKAFMVIGSMVLACLLR